MRKKHTNEPGNAGHFYPQSRTEAEDDLNLVENTVGVRVCPDPRYEADTEGLPTIGAGSYGPELVWDNGARRKFRSAAISTALKKIRTVSLRPALCSTPSEQQLSNRQDEALEASLELGHAVRAFIRSHGGDTNMLIQ